MADGDDPAPYRVELPQDCDLPRALAIGRAFAETFETSECVFHADAPVLSRIAAALTRTHSIGVEFRTEQRLPVRLPDVLMRGDMEEAFVAFREDRPFSTFLSMRNIAPWPPRTELSLSGSYSVTDEQTDAFFAQRLALCEPFLVGDAPRVTHPLVVTNIPLRIGSFSTLAVSPAIADGYTGYLLHAKIGFAHGAEAAHALLRTLSSADEFKLHLPNRDAAALISVAEQLPAELDVRVTWPIHTDVPLDAKYATATVRTLELTRKDGRISMMIDASHHRATPANLQKEFARRAGCPVIGWVLPG